MKKIKAKKTAAMLCLCGALCAGTGLALAYTPSLYPQTAIVASAETNSYGGLNLTKRIKEGDYGGWLSEESSSILVFNFADTINFSNGSKMDEAVIADGKTWDEYFFLHSTAEESDRALSMKEWKEKGKSYRVCTFGKSVVVMFENNSHAGGSEIDYVQLKAGIKMFAVGESSADTSDWIFSKKCDSAVADTEFTKDLTLWVNRSTNLFEYKAGEADDALTLTQAKNSPHWVGEDELKDGVLSLEVKTTDNDTVTVPVNAAMCSGDDMTDGKFNKAGNSQTVTVSYGGKSVTQTVSIPVYDRAKFKLNVSSAAEGETAPAITFDTGEDFTSTAKITHIEALKTVPVSVTYKKNSPEVDKVDFKASGEGVEITRLVELNFVKDGVETKVALHTLATAEEGETPLMAPYFKGNQLVLAGVDSETVQEQYGTLDWVRVDNAFMLFTAESDTNASTNAEACTPQWSYIVNSYTVDVNKSDKSATTAHYYFDFYNGKTLYAVSNQNDDNKIADSTGFKTTYEVDETPDFSSVVLQMKYRGTSKKGTISRCPEVIIEPQYDFSAAGDTQVTFKVNGRTLCNKAGTPVSIAVSVVENVVTPESIALKDGTTVSYKRFGKESILSDGAAIVVTFSDDTTRDVPLTKEMLSAIDDTSAAGQKTVTLTYTDSGSLQKFEEEISVTVLEECVPSAILGIDYGANGDDAAVHNRSLALKFADGITTPIVYYQEACASLIPEKTIGDLVLIKFKNKTEPVALSALNGVWIGSFGSGANFICGLNEYVANAEYGSVEYVKISAGFVMYTYSTDSPSAGNADKYYPLATKDGTLAYFDHDTYLTWTADTGNYGKVVEPLKSLSVTLADGAKTSYRPAETLDLTGITYTAQYVDPAKQDASGSVTAEMCSAVPSEAGNHKIAVTLNNATATFDITVVEVPRPSTLDATGIALTAKRFAFQSEIEIPADAKLTVTYTADGGSKQVALTREMLGTVDTSTAGEKDCEISYTDAGVTVKTTVKVTVSQETVQSNVAGIGYGADGKNVTSNRSLRIALADDSGMKVTLNQHLCASAIAGKLNGELVLVKVKGQEELIPVSTNGYSFGWWGDFYLGVPDGVVPEYAVVKAGVLLYTYTEDTTSGNTGDYFVHKVNGARSVVTEDLYLTWTGASGDYGKVVEPLKSLSVTLTDGAKTSYRPADALDLTGVTYTAQYVNPAKQDASGSVTAEMCSKVPSEAGNHKITVTLNNATATFDITVIEVPRPSTFDATEVALTAKRFAHHSQIVIPENTKITVTYTSDGGSKQVALTHEMLGAVDTSKAGEADCVISFTDAGVTVTATVKVTVAEECENSLLSINYGADGSTTGGRNLAIKVQDGVPYKVAINQNNLASLIPDKTTGDLVLVKFANKSDPVSIKTLNANLGVWGNVFLGGLDGYVTNAEYGSIEYLVIKAGFLLYTYSEDDANGAHTAEYYPIESEGAYAYFDHDVYLIWTADTGSYGKVAQPYKSLTVTLAEGAKKEYFPGEELDLTGVTFEAEYVDPAKTEKATGSVTPDMCSLVPDTAGTTQISVKLNGAVGTFSITVLKAERQPASIALSDSTLLTYHRYAIEPNIKEGCNLVVTYDDGTTKEVLLKKEWIVVRPDTTQKSMQDVTISYKEYGKTVTVTVKVQVWDKVVESNIEGVAFGTDAGSSDVFGVNFNYKAGGADNLKALGNIKSMESAIKGVTNGELVLAKFANEAEPIALSDERLAAVQLQTYGGKLAVLGRENVSATLGELEYLIVKTGFLWYNAPADTFNDGANADTSAYVPVAANIVTKDLYVGFTGGKLEKPVAGVAIEKEENYKTAYIKGEDLSLKFKLVITYLDPDEEQEKVEATREMCGAIVGDATAAQAQITYRGQTVALVGLTYDGSRELGGLVIETQGKTEYSFAVEEFDLSGYVVKMIVKDVAMGDEVERRSVDAADIQVDGFDSHTLGKQTVTLSFSGEETSVEVNVVNDEPEKHMTIEYMATYDSYDRSVLHGIAVHFGFTTEVGNVSSESFLYAAQLPNVADKLLINGRLASEWIEEGAIEFIGFYGNVVYIRFSSNLLQPTKEPTKGYGTYEEGVTELVETITFLPGFQFYAVDKNFWGNTDWTESDVTPVKHGVVKETITLENIELGSGWVRQFKLNAEGTAMADDAITVASLPAKTQFTVGDEITKDVLLEGLKLHFKYEDGGEEDWQPGIMDIEFDGNISATAGKKTVTVFFKDNDHFVTFEIEVAEKPQEPEKGLSGGAIAGIVIGSVLGVGGIAAATAVLVKKQKGKKGEDE